MKYKMKKCWCCNGTGYITIVVGHCINGNKHVFTTENGSRSNECLVCGKTQKEAKKQVAKRYSKKRSVEG